MGILKKKKKIMRNIKINWRDIEKRNKVKPTLDEMREREGIIQCIKTETLTSRLHIKSRP